MYIRENCEVMVQIMSELNEFRRNLEEIERIMSVRDQISRSYKRCSTTSTM